MRHVACYCLHLFEHVVTVMLLALLQIDDDFDEHEFHTLLLL